MDHDGPCILRVTGLHLLEELQHADRGERHPKVWPAGKVELSDEALWLSVGDVAHLQSEEILNVGPDTLGWVGQHQGRKDKA